MRGVHQDVQVTLGLVFAAGGGAEQAGVFRPVPADDGVDFVAVAHKGFGREHEWDLADFCAARIRRHEKAMGWLHEGDDPPGAPR